MSQEEEVDQFFKGRHGKPVEDDTLRVLRFLSHRPNYKYTAQAVSERVANIQNPKRLGDNLSAIARRGKTGLRYESQGQGSRNYYWWANPDVTQWEYIPTMSNGTTTSIQPAKEKQVTTDETKNVNRGIGKLVAFHLADHPNRTFTTEQIAREFGVETKVASNALNNVAMRVPEIQRVARGMYRWFGEGTKLPETVAATEERAEEEVEEQIIDVPAPTPPASTSILFRLVSVKDEKMVLKDNEGNLWKCEKIDW